MPRLDAIMKRVVEDIACARKAIMKEVDPTCTVQHGAMDCPVCKRGLLTWSFYNPNRHVKARCSSLTCVYWQDASGT